MGNAMERQVNKLMASGNLDVEELRELLRFRNQETTDYLYEMACVMRQKTKGNVVTMWGRIPISSYCKYDCKMCGLRRENQFAKRYRLEKEQILQYCHEFEKQGITHFLLESGDDVYYTESRLAEIILSIKKYHPTAEIILSVGEKTAAAYRHWFHVGASSYMLRYGSADELHFKKIYPSNMSLLLRKQSLWELRQEGYGVGTGFLVGLPYQTVDNVIEDIRFVQEFAPKFVDIGAFVPALRTPFEKERSGNGDMTLYLMAIFRLMLPKTSIVADTTLDCVLRDGQMRALEAGADIMIVDITDDAILGEYKVYEPAGNRMGRLLNSGERIKEQITRMGLKTE